MNAKNETERRNVVFIQGQAHSTGESNPSGVNRNG